MRIGLREIVFFALLGCLPIGAWLFVFKPHNARADEISKEIKVKQHNLLQKNLAAASIVELEQEVVSLETAMEYFRSKLPDQRQIPVILQEISQLVTTHKLKCISIRPVNKVTGSKIKFTPEKGPHSEQSIDIRVEGDFMDFYLFLQSLESLPRITRIEKLNIAGSQLSAIRAAGDALLEGQPISDNTLPMGHVIVNFKMSIFFARATK